MDTEETVVLSDLMCRTCLKKDAHKNLFDQHKPTSSEFASLLKACISIQISKYDGLPEKICSTCLKNLVSFYNFKVSVIENDFKLRKTLALQREEESKKARDDVYSVRAINTNIEEVELDVQTYQVIIEEFKIEKVEHPVIGDEEIKVGPVEIGPDDSTLVTDLDSDIKSDQYQSGHKDIGESNASGKKNRKRKKKNGHFQCHICSKTLSAKRSLQDHLRVHSGERPFSCNVCDKKFSNAHNLSTHRRIHTGERPHQCLICKKKFGDYTTLKAHLRTHTGERPYTCTDCGKSFSQSSTLSKHSRGHSTVSPYPCTECKKCFKNSANLNTHMRFHRNDRPYGCDQCDKRFVTSSHLNTHAKKHWREAAHVFGVRQGV